MASTGKALDEQRSHHACTNCRRKKVRCPGERPFCSSCTRLNQACHYRPSRRKSTFKQSESHLASREKHVGPKKDKNRDIHTHSLPNYVNEDEQQSRAYHPFQGSTSRPSTSLILEALDLYFQHCHRQPIWCFESEDVKDVSNLTDELVFTLLALTSRYSSRHDTVQRRVQDARNAIMLRLANGSAGVQTLESLCLLSYSFLLDGNVQLGQFHLGLGIQLCQSASMDLATTYSIDCVALEAKKRTFWSLQILEQSYGRRYGMLQITTNVWQPPHRLGLQSPPMPGNPDDASDIWCYTSDIGWNWSRVRKYVVDAASYELREPWRNDSDYASIVSDLMLAENNMPVAHRYDTVKFFQRTSEELNANKNYWKPWLRLQFCYHTCQAVLNHPFLYIVASKHNPELAAVNTFWRRSTELVLLHATWISRMIDMVTDKNMQLSDPFFAHAAAIAATIHLYFCCAADSRLRMKSRTDFETCRRFIADFTLFSGSCCVLQQNLDQLVQIAFNSNDSDVGERQPTRINLRTSLIWDILELKCPDKSSESVANALLHPSLNLDPDIVAVEDSVVEVAIAESPEVTVNTCDGGQSGSVSSLSKLNSTVESGDIIIQHNSAEMPESLKINPSWLSNHYSEDTGLVTTNEDEFLSSIISSGDGNMWWDFDNL